MNSLLGSLTSKKINYGHFRISIKMNEKRISTTTTNTLAIDAAFDPYYDDGDNSDSFYANIEEARIALFYEILRNQTQILCQNTKILLH